jgi:hypothetical protein
MTDLAMGMVDWLAFLLRFLKISFILRISWLLVCTWPLSSFITSTARSTTVSKLTCSP